MERPSNKPRAELEALAAHAIRVHGGPTVARVFFKFDCSGCRARVTVSEPGVLPRRAKCEACGVWTAVERGGFLLQRRPSARDSWLGPSTVHVQRDYRHVPAASVAIEFER